MEKMKIAEFKEPNLLGLIDQDILDRFKDTCVTYDCIVNAQLIKTNKDLIEAIKNDR